MRLLIAGASHGVDNCMFDYSKMLKSLSFFVNYSRCVLSSFELLSSFSLVRLSNSKKYGSGSINEDDKKEQFSGPIPVDFLKIKYVRSPGPGGQNVNKVNTKVDLRFHVMSAEWLPFWIREKLHEKEGHRINREGELVVQCSRFRSQHKNLEEGLQKVREILEDVSYIPKETSEEKKAKISDMIKSHHERRLQDKKFRSQRKQERSRNQ